MSNPNAPENTRSQRREQAAADALRSFIRDTLQEKFPLLDTEEIDLPLNLSLHISCAESGELQFEPDLRSQVIAQAEAHLNPLGIFQDGTVYDFYDKQPKRPPSALSAFAGYDAFGHPKWTPVSELKIFRGKELKTEQLSAYGKNDKAFNILGQVTLGPLPVPKAYQPLTGTDSFALTIQIVETRNTRAHFSLELNLLVGGLLPDERDEMLQELPLRQIHQALRALEQEVDLLRHHAEKAWTDQDNKRFNHELQKVPKLLADFANQ
ncbi:hypothetical protein P0Y35_11395 [Kiritimatiellaeota bacterium B1221]|nr:hypothetical protein [Kiritimatiellaeota bacterium B1221]